MLTLGVTLLEEEERVSGCERMICQVSDTAGTQGSVLFGVGRGVGLDDGGEESPSLSLSRPKVRPRPNPRPSARITMARAINKTSLRRRDHGWRGLGFASIVLFCDALSE